MSHKSGTVIVRMEAVADPDPIRSVNVEIDVTGKTPEEAAAAIRRVMRKIEQMSAEDE